MKKQDLLDFARRDWALLSESKAAYWAERKRTFGPAEAIQTADETRRHALFLHPDWPTEGDRLRDIETHARVAQLLRLVLPVKGR